MSPVLVVTFKRVFLGLLGSFLLIDAVYLFTRSVTNFGSQLPFVAGLILIVLAWQWRRWHALLQTHTALRTLWRLACVGGALWLLSLIAFFAYIAKSQDTALSGFQPVAILVLGSSAVNGKPQPTLALRLDKAVALYKQLPNAVIVPSGGVDRNETISEAAAMSNYMQARGVPAQAIAIEDKSRSTYENFIFTKALLKARGLGDNPAVLVVSSDFHLLRASFIAQRAGLTHVRYAGSETPLYMRYNAMLREYFAFASGWLLGEY